MLDISIMFCTYILSNSNIDIKYESNKIINNLKNMILERENNDTYISYENDISDRKKVFLDYVNFEEYEKKYCINDDEDNIMIDEILLSLSR